MPLSTPTEVPKRQRAFFTDTEIRALETYIASLKHGPPVPHPHPESASVADGLHLFTDRCAGCHQVVAEGGYVTNTPVPVLDQATPTEIAEAVRIGPYVMPKFSRRSLSNPELNAIVAYVVASQAPDDRGGLGIGHIGPVPEGIVAWIVAAVVLIAVCVFLGERLRRT